MVLREYLIIFHSGWYSLNNGVLISFQANTVLILDPQKVDNRIQIPNMGESLTMFVPKVPTDKENNVGN